jgi:ribokinase
MSSKIINIGSINTDHVYSVSQMPNAGETILAKSYQKFLGGKGTNQSIAAVKAGANLIHVGAVAENDTWIVEEIEKFGVASSHIEKSKHATGHAIIFVDDAAENEIVIFGGANQNLQQAKIDEALDEANGGDNWVLIQTETNLLLEIVSKAKDRGIKVAYAAAPFVEEIALELVDKIDLLAVNEGEASQLAKALNVNPDSLPGPKLLITKGAQGATFIENEKRFDQPAFEVKAVDTTGAGDTFLGSFLAVYVEAGNAVIALEYASAASALQVTKAGAAIAIPEKQEVEAFLELRKTR